MKFSVDEKALLGDLFVMLLALFCLLFSLNKLFFFVFNPLRVVGGSGFNVIVWGLCLV